MLTNPYMLAALAAAGLPWIIEWLMRRHRRIVELPTLRFLLASPEQKKVRLQDLLLLLMRSGVILVLVAALVRPVFRPSGRAPGGGPPHAVLIFDATYSNAQKSGSDTAFALARRTGSEIVAGLPRGARVTVASLSDRLTVEVQAGDDLPAVRERIERLRVADTAGHVADALQWAEDYLAAHQPPAEIYILSDMQRSTWAPRPGLAGGPAERLERLSRRHRVYLADTGGDDPANGFVTHFAPVESILAVGVPATFRATVETTNLDPRAGWRAELAFYVDGQRQAMRSFVMGSSPHTAEFRHTFLQPGTHLLKVALAGDAHAMDNERHYLAGVPDSHRVLVVDDRPEAGLFEGDSGLFRLAVDPPRRQGLEKVSLFAATACTVEQFDRHNLADYQVVVLANLGRLPQAMVAALEAFVADGGALMVLLGDRVLPFEHNRRLHRDGAGLLPCALEEAATAAQGQDLSLIFASPAGQGPDVLRGRLAGEGGVRRYVRLGLADAASAPAGGGADVLASFSDGAAALVERAFGQGRVLLYAGSASPAWGTLPLSQRFPVLCQELLRHLVGEPDGGVNLEIGEAYEQPVLLTSRHLTLRRPDGRKARLTPVQRAGETLRHVRYEQTDRAGLYEVDTPAEVLARRQFVVNRRATESDLARMDAGRLRLAYGPVAVSQLPPLFRVRRHVEEMHSVTEAAGGLLAALFVLLACEALLAFHFGRRRA